MIVLYLVAIEEEETEARRDLPRTIPIPTRRFLCSSRSNRKTSFDFETQIIRSKSAVCFSGRNSQFLSEREREGELLACDRRRGRSSMVVCLWSLAGPFIFFLSFYSFFSFCPFLSTFSIKTPVFTNNSNITPNKTNCQENIQTISHLESLSKKQKRHLEYPK